MESSIQPMSVAQAVELACTLEASAPKVGNVHPLASFSDMTFDHFLASVSAIIPTFSDCTDKSVGQLILDAVTATRNQVGRNTNLGTILLLGPLAKAAVRAGAKEHRLTQDQLEASVVEVLQALTKEDSQHIYEAIRVARPGGLGEQSSNDIRSNAPDNIVEAMTQVAKHDAVARQYTNGYTDIFRYLLPWLGQEIHNGHEMLSAIVRLQLRWLAREVDGLIVRKCGLREAQNIQSRAESTWKLMQTDHPRASAELAELDRYLRDERNARNPGTTADLIAATLFCQQICQS